MYVRYWVAFFKCKLFLIELIEIFKIGLFHEILRHGRHQNLDHRLFLRLRNLFLHLKLKMFVTICVRSYAQRTGGRLNLNFQAHPYGMASLNPWNMPKNPIKTLNSKIDFKALNRAIFCHFLIEILKTMIFEFLVEF